MKKICLILVCMFASSFFLAGCNTIQGIGKDVKKAGEVVEDAGRK